MKRQNPLLSLFIAGMIGGFPVSAQAADASVEVIPLAIWQGRNARPWNVTAVKELRSEFPGGRVAHVVSAAPFARGESQGQEFRRNFQSAVLPGDEIAMHIAPWKSLATSAKVTFKFGPTLYGNDLVPKACESECGLDLSFRAFNRRESAEMIRKSREILEREGFGKIRAIYFEEGLAPEAARSAATDAGMSEDWSGIAPVQLTSSLNRFPIASWNEELMKDLPLSKTSKTTDGILNLDHVRFSIHSEIGDLEAVKAVMKSAIDAAKSSSRPVRVPIVFNVDDLIHTRGFVLEALRLARKEIFDAGIKAPTLTALNKSWKFDTMAATDPVPLPVPATAIVEKASEPAAPTEREPVAASIPVETVVLAKPVEKAVETPSSPAVAKVVESAAGTLPTTRDASSDEPEFIPQDELESLGDGSASVIAH